MKQELFLGVVMGLAVLPVLPVMAQDAIYRCGNEYTNTRPDAVARGCKLIEAGNVTVVEAVRQPKPASRSTAASNATVSNGAGNRIESGEQKARDSDARLILQSELQKAQTRQDELQKEYNNGAPEKRGDEARNHQKYLDRVAELKASLARNESDVAGIRRELERLPGAGTAALAR
jgi:hypothetical protein